MSKERQFTPRTSAFLFAGLLLAVSLPPSASSSVTLEAEYKLNDESLFFDGKKVGDGAPNSATGYDYFFGSALTPHGDCVKVYKHFVFMTWYRGGKEDRHVMLTRLNTLTGSMKTIEFPHRHTGYLNQWWIGETHNTIAVGISPINGTIHLLYDMHAYTPTKPSGGAFANDYFRYTYSVPNAADAPDEDFTLDQFVKSPDGDYKHLTMTGVENANLWGGLTYPKFFLNDGGDLFMYMRKGGSSNGKFIFTKYDGVSKWEDQTSFNVTEAANKGMAHNYGVYGEMKYANGKVRMAFQMRSNDRNDRYIYQNGAYYAYSDSQGGKSDWKNHKGEPFDLPLVDPEFIKVFEPGDFVDGTQKDKIHMVGSFDFNVTDRGDEHIIARVTDNQNNVRKNLHAYRPAGATDFTVTTDFFGGDELYTSGNFIYLITLKNGRPFIQVTEGGTNDWITAYEPTTGLSFDKGVPYISNGKLYYYLKVPGSGDKRTTYLQIVDLAIEIVRPPISAGGDQTVFDSDLDGFATVQLDGVLNPNYPASDIVWLKNGFEIAQGLSAAVELEFGVHTLTLAARSGGQIISDDLNVTVQPASNVVPKVVLGWEKWDAPEATYTNGATGVFSASSDWKLSIFGASDDASFGSLSSPAANTDRSDSPVVDGLRLGVDSDSILFTIVNGDAPVDLAGFHFDAARRGDATSEFQLEVGNGSAIQSGLVAEGNVPKIFGANLGDFDIDLSNLADRRLGPGESATFKLSFSGGEGVNLDFDNAAISVSPDIRYLGYPDSDDDKLPDYWEMLHFGHLDFTGDDDPDGDGRTNFQEFVEGTRPKDASSVFRPAIAWSEDKGLHLRWPNDGGREFRVLRAADLAEDNWQLVANEFVPGDNELSLILPEESDLYRLEVKRRSVAEAPVDPSL